MFKVHEDGFLPVFFFVLLRSSTSKLEARLGNIYCYVPMGLGPGDRAYIH